MPGGGNWKVVGECEGPEGRGGDVEAYIDVI